jgi:hypothetical protein
MSLNNKIKQFIVDLNEKGFPLPLLRDPKIDGPSVSLTLMVISFVIAAGGLIGKFTKLTGDIDISGANYLFISTAALYFGRKISGDTTKKTIELEEGKEDK